MEFDIYARVYEGSSRKEKNIQLVLIVASKLKFTERATQSEHQNCQSWQRRATLSTGLHARRATGLTVAEREEKPCPDRIDSEVVEAGRAAYETGRGCVARLFLFLTFQSRRKYYMRGYGDFVFPSRNVRFHFRCSFIYITTKGTLAVSSTDRSILTFLPCCCVVLCLLFRTCSIYIKMRK